MNLSNSIRYDHYGQYECLEDIKNDSVDLCLATCGMEVCAPKHAFGPGTRPFYIFHFILDGYGYFEHNGTTTKLGPNEVFLIRPEEVTHYRADEKNPWQYVWVGFSGLKASGYVKYAGYGENRLTGTFENCLLIKSYVRQMINCRTYTPANDLKRNAALMEILALLIDASIDKPDYSPASQKQEYIDKARKLIELNYSKTITVHTLAENIGIDRSYLTRIFKEILSITPQEYLKQFRLHKAAQLLQDPVVKISAVAHAVGYQDYVTFSRLFKQYKGVTPIEYRKQKLP